MDADGPRHAVGGKGRDAPPTETDSLLPPGAAAGGGARPAALRTEPRGDDGVSARHGLRNAHGLRMIAWASEESLPSPPAPLPYE